MKERILIVDDDDNICQLLKLYLEKENYETNIVHDGDAAVKSVASADLVLLDIMMPGKDGYETLKEIREFSRVPVIMLSAKSETADKISGLDYGADDYVTKPFEPAELISRVKALLRRIAPPSQNEIVLGNLTVSLEKYAVTVNGEVLDMPPKEIEVLEYLARNSGKAVSRDELVGKVWGDGYKGDSRTVDVHIKRIREKIAKSDCNLLTVWGVGYKLEVK